MHKLTKSINKLLFIAFLLIFICISFFLFVGCNSEYEKTNAYALFKDNYGNEYKVEGKERIRNNVDTRVFSRTVYYDYDPDAVYTITTGVYIKDGGKRIVTDEDNAVFESGIRLTDKTSYDILTKNTLGFGVSIHDAASSDEGIKLYGSKPGTYHIYVKVSYEWDHGDEYSWRPDDCYFLIVHINGDIKNTHANAVINDGAGNTYTVQGHERSGDDKQLRVFEQTITLDAADEVTYTFTGGLYYADGGEQIIVDKAYDWVGDGYYNKVNAIVQTDSISYQKLVNGSSSTVNTFDNRGGIVLDGSKPVTYYLVMSAEYYIGNKWRGDGKVRWYCDYYFLIVNIV